MRETKKKEIINKVKYIRRKTNNGNGNGIKDLFRKISGKQSLQY